MRSMRAPATLLVVALVAGGPAAVASGVTAAAAPVVGPAGDAFYVPPDPLPPGEPGDLVWYREVDPPVFPVPLPGFEPGGRAWRVLYHSRGVAGEDVAVSGYVLAPDGPAPAGGWHVESVGHGTAGIGDCNAPSRFVFPFDPGNRVLAFSDYEGLGPPGPHPYLVGSSAGRNMLDIARATAQIPGLSVSDRVALSGFSQGGQATLFAGELAATYAPELDVVGTAASAPPADLTGIAETAATSAIIGYSLYVTWGFAHSYGFDLEELLIPAAIDALEAADACAFAPGVRSVWSFTADEAYLFDPDEMPPAWYDALEENSAGAVPSVPVFVFAGELDPVVPLSTVHAYVERACASGTHVTLVVVPGGGHGAAGPVGDEWTAARLAGEPLGSSACNGDDGTLPGSPSPGGTTVAGTAAPAEPVAATPNFTG